MRFDLASIPAGTIVQSAAFEAYLIQSGGTSPVTLDAHRVTGAWTEGGVTWNNQPPADAAAEGSTSVGTLTGYKSWNVKNLAQSWINGSLPNHGLELRGPLSGYWSRAFSSREGGDCPRLVLTLQSAVPIPTPTATATFTPSPTPSLVPAPVSRSVLITGVEINQSVQDMNSLQVPLVAGKKTVVRVHLQVTDGLGSLAGVRGYLYYTYPWGGLYSPINPGGVVTALSNPDRGQLNHTLNFLLPASAATGSGTMLIRVLPPAGVVFPGSGELQDSRLVSFGAVPAMRLRLIGVTYITGTVTYAPRNLDYARLEAWLRAAYPIGTLVSTRGTFPYTFAGLPTCGKVNQLLAAIKLLDVVFGSETSATRYHGLVFQGLPAWYFMPGCCCNSGTSSGPTGADTWGWDNDGSFGDWYGGHEIGHGYGLCHPGFCENQGKDTSAHCAPYPYDNGAIGGPPNDPARYYGLDTDSLQVYGPTWTDMMTYCNNQWISDFNYKRLHNKLLNPLAFSITAGAPQERLLVQGTLDPQTDAVTLDPSLRIPNAVEAVQRAPGAYTIVLADAQGTPLAAYPFTPRSQEVDEFTRGASCSGTTARPAASVPAAIFEFVPWVNGTARVSIWHGAQELAGRNVSANAPTVQVMAPNGGEAVSGGAINVTWSASDLDGDALTFTVLYSSDGGATWTTVATGAGGTGHAVDAGLLAGSGAALIRVMASDGVNTASDQSDAPFTVAGQPPRASISAPADQAQFEPGALLALSGSAYDPETGLLGDAALTWESDRDGQLGTGATLIRAVGDLSRGLHQITLRATDNDGLEGSATISVYIGHRTHLPLVTKGPVR